ncbi:hypothetical protein M8C21_033346, partial [Ambrosia artemisiifolia]
MIRYFLFLLFLQPCLITKTHSKTAITKLPGYAGDLPFKLETGYVGTKENEDIKLFYYFVESARDPKEDPLIVHFRGGPGASSLLGLINEIGNERGDQPAVNVQGYILSSPLTNKFLDFNSRLEYAYRVALISDDIHMVLNIAIEEWANMEVVQQALGVR